MNKTTVPINDVVEVINEKISENGEVIFKITGNSMYPFLKDGLDAVQLSKVEAPLKRGDIVLFQYGKKYILHRIERVGHSTLKICGDASVRCEFVDIDSVIGRVNKIIKENKEIYPDENKSYQFRVKLWMLLKPIRRYIIWMIRHIFKRI